MLSLKERESATVRLATLIEKRTTYTRQLIEAKSEDMELICAMLNEVYEGIRMARRSLGHLHGIKKRKISVMQALKFKELYSDGDGTKMSA